MPIKLFVSHISEEGDIAALLKQTMQKDFIGLVEFFTSSDIGSISAGEDWLSAVQHAMNEATAVLVLCSKASVLRPWVQFELGAAWMKEVPIIPICHSGLLVAELQMPLSLKQGIQLGTEKGVRRLYDAVGTLLKLPQPPEPRDLPGFLKEIARLAGTFEAGGVQQYERHIDIVIPAPGQLPEPMIPDDVRVESNELSLQLFGLNGTVKKWRDIARAARKGRDQRWLEQLQYCVSLASRNEGFRPVQAIFHTDTASYQPQLAKKETQPDGSCRFHVHFVETTAAPLMEVQNQLGMLVTLLRLGMRFRYEVLERFRKRIVAMSAQELEAQKSDILRNLRRAIEIIEIDYASRGSVRVDPSRDANPVDRDAVTELFDTDDDLREMAEMSEIWTTVRGRLFSDSPAPTVDEIKNAIAQVREMNFRFLRLASRRYHEMICTVLAPPPAPVPRVSPPASASAPMN
ncbi:MAG: toll/interleukin-1 receptor domain-containing protein [Povalibacter sp.]